MVTTVLHTIAKYGNDLNVINGQMDKDMCYMQTVDYNSPFKKEEVLPFATNI